MTTRCPYCRGSGKDYADERQTHWVMCGDCGGTGRVDDGDSMWEDKKFEEYRDREFDEPIDRKGN